LLTELIDSRIASIYAAAPTAASAVKTMRRRCGLVSLVRYISISMTAEQRTSWPYHAREKASRIASEMMPSKIALHVDFQKRSVTTD